jgi:PAS domain S-box-containing protein
MTVRAVGEDSGAGAAAPPNDGGLSTVFLLGGGEMGARIRTHDWAATPIGPMENWPSALRSALGICLTSSFPTAIYWGPDWRLFYNDAWAPIPAEKHPWALGRTAREVWPDIWEVIEPQFAQVMRTAEGFSTFNQMLPMQRGGVVHETWWNYSLTPLRGDNGAVCGLFNQGNETTDRVLGERRIAFLLSLSDRLRGIESPRDIVTAAVRALGAHLKADRVGYAQVRADDLTATLISDFSDGVVALDGDFPLDAFGPANIRRLRSGASSVYDDVATAPDMDGSALAPSQIQALIAVPLIRDDRLSAVLYVNHRRPRHWRPDEVSLAEDVAARIWDAVERVHAEQLRRESEANFRAIANSIDPMIWSTRPDGFHDYYSDRWYEYTGVPKGSTDGEAWNGMFHPDDQARAWATWRHSLQTGEPYHIEYRLRHRSGSYRWVLGRAQPVRDDEGRITRWFGTCTDIQDIVDAREVLARSREELEREIDRRTHALLVTEEQLRQSQKMEAVGQLTGGIAHDFNNLLTGIIGSLELLQTRLARGEIRDLDRYILPAQSSARRAAALTHRLLAFSRRQTLEPRAIDINRLVAGMIELIDRTVGPTIQTEVVGAAGLWATFVDQNQLESALLNLCINARDAMPRGGRLTIETGNRWMDERAARERDLQPGQYVSLCVSDTGTGMSPEVIRRAFDPFFTTKPIGQGTGLGLSMIYGFARQSGGQARIYSEPGQGAMVCLYLPRHLGDAERIEDVRPPALERRAALGESVLVVDDEPTVRMLVAEVLADLGYAAIEASDGPAGLRVLRSDTRVDLLVTDVGLPGGMNGRQLAEAGRRSRPDLKVLFITGYAENAVISHGHLAPGMHVLTKPFAMEALASRIRDIIGRPDAAAQKPADGGGD